MGSIKTLLPLLVLLLFSIKTPLVSAQESQVMPIPPPDTSTVLGQEHAYSVLFRGNGDAVVTMRAAFTNDESSQTNTVSFRIPRVEPRRISAFQVIREPEFDYFQWYGQAKYQKAKTDFSGDTLTITLPQSIKPNKSGAVFVIYSATGYTKKDLFGAYSYAFETFKVETSSVSKATIGVSVDSDLVLAGAKGQVNYRFSESDAMMVASSAEKMAVQSPQLDQLYSQIGYGTITKNVSHLEPLESYTVRGRFADSWLRLYAKRLLLGILAFLAFVVGIILIGKRLVKNLTKQQAGVLALGLGVFGLAVAFLLMITVGIVLVILLLLRNAWYPPIIMPQTQTMVESTDARSSPR